MKKIYCAWLIFFFQFVFSLPAYAVYESQMQSATQWLYGQQNSDGSWGSSDDEKFILTVESVQALADAGQRSADYYEGITWLENHAYNNADYLSRRATALLYHGDDINASISYAETAQDTSMTGRSGWGISQHYHQSPLDTALVLYLLDSVTTSSDIAAALNYLKASQITSAGWSLSNEAVSDAVTTAWVVRAMTRHTDLDSSLSSNIADALTELSNNVSTGAPIYLQALSARAALDAADTTTAQPWLTQLATVQASNGSWNDNIYDTALSLQSFATADGVNTAANQTMVNIPDNNLRAAINNQLGRNVMDNLTRNELAQLTSLTANDLTIDDLTGLEWAVNLISADLRNNNIDDTTPIDGLPNVANFLLSGNPVAGGSGSQQVPLPLWVVITMAMLLIIIGLWTNHRQNKIGPYQQSITR